MTEALEVVEQKTECLLAPVSGIRIPTARQIERLGVALSEFPQVDCPLIHRFQDDNKVYLREIYMPANIYVIGHEHKFEHYNIVVSGRAKVLFDGKVHDIVAGNTFRSGPGVRKVLRIDEDMRWITVHHNPTGETDIRVLEDKLVNKFISLAEMDVLELEFSELQQLMAGGETK